MDPDEKDEIPMPPAPPTQQTAAGETPPNEPAAAGEPVAQPEPAWKDYIIKGIGKEVRQGEFFGKRLGELSPKQLDMIETKWLPALRTQWEDASEIQRAEMPMLEAAIAYYKMAKPW
jgi:hypothetical protein